MANFSSIPALRGAIGAESLSALGRNSYSRQQTGLRGGL